MWGTQFIGVVDYLKTPSAYVREFSPFVSIWIKTFPLGGTHLVWVSGGSAFHNINWWRGELTWVRESSRSQKNYFKCELLSGVQYAVTEQPVVLWKCLRRGHAICSNIERKAASHLSHGDSLSLDIGASLCGHSLFLYISLSSFPPPRLTFLLSPYAVTPLHYFKAALCALRMIPIVLFKVFKVNTYWTFAYWTEYSHSSSKDLIHVQVRRKQWEFIRQPGRAERLQRFVLLPTQHFVLSRPVVWPIGYGERNVLAGFQL